MNTEELRSTIELIDGYYAHEREDDECYPERWCLVQLMIYNGDYDSRCPNCKFDCDWGLRFFERGCCRPWYCNIILDKPNKI